MELYSNTKVSAANYCIMKLYLKYHAPIHVKPLRLSAYSKGIFWHELIRHFWNKLGTPEEVAKKSSSKKYFDANSFDDYAQGKWKSCIIADQKSKEKITWDYENEPWVILSSIKRISVPLFNFIIEEGRPLFSELPFRFIIDNVEFYGKIDAVRLKDKIIIIDYKSGNPWMKEMRLKFDPQLTLYNTGLCSLCMGDEKIAKKLGLERRLEEFMAGNKFVSPNIEEQFFMIEALDPKKNISNPIFKTKRRDEHFIEVLKMVKGSMKTIREGNIYPERGTKCGGCDVRHVCSKELENVEKGSIIDKKGQMFLSIINPLYVEKEKEHRIKQKTFPWRYKK